MRQAFTQLIDGIDLGLLFCSLATILFMVVGCGAHDETAYLDVIERAGFVDVRIVDRVTYPAEGVRGLVDGDKEFTAEERAARDSLWEQVDHKVSSVRVYALKPQKA